MPLAICFILAIVITLLGRAEASIFDNARAKLTDWSSPLLTGIRQPFATVEGWAGGIDSLLAIHRENLQLRQENAELRKWQNAALALEQRVQRYELMLNAVPDPQLATTMAHVIGQSNRPERRHAAWHPEGPGRARRPRPDRPCLSRRRTHLLGHSARRP
jgi:rod shape-determining protein MreC